MVRRFVTFPHKALGVMFVPTDLLLIDFISHLHVDIISEMVTQGKIFGDFLKTLHFVRI